MFLDILCLIPKVFLHRSGFCSLSFCSATSSSWSLTLEGVFELTQRPSRALNSPRVLLPELHRNKDTVRCQVCLARRGGPMTQSTTADANLDCAFVENALVFAVPNIGGAPLSLPLFTTYPTSYVSTRGHGKLRLSR